MERFMASLQKRFSQSRPLWLKRIKGQVVNHSYATPEHLAGDYAWANFGREATAGANTVIAVAESDDTLAKQRVGSRARNNAPINLGHQRSLSLGVAAERLGGYHRYRYNP
jgi:hypothetical protein